MTSQLPLISVIIPAYNRELYLAEAIESVLNQTYPHIELIVIDDGSSDRTGEIARSYSIVYRFQANAGMGAARNAGIALATGEFIAFLDSDDIWKVDKLSKQMAAFAADPNLEAVFGHVEQFYSPELDRAFRQRIRCPDRPLPGYASTTMLIERSALLRIGLFDPHLKVGADVSWYAMARDLDLQHEMLVDVVYRRRLHQTNNGIVARNHTNERMHVLKAKLDRQRAKQTKSS